MSELLYATDRLTSYRTRLEEEIERILGAYLDNYRQSMTTPHGHDIVEALRSFTARPGKRLRGSLVLFAYEMYSGKTADKDIYRIAVAIELLQNYLLIIDDVMDSSPTRRGGNSLHMSFVKSLPNNVSDDRKLHYSNMLAIDIGLLAQHMAVDLITQTALRSDTIVKIIQYVQQNMILTAFGQFEDLYSVVERPTNQNNVLQMLMFKSSYYTFVNPLQVGAIAAGASDDVIKATEEYGRNVGLAFQIQDDIIGLFGDPSETGKSSLDDLKDGKVTLLITHTLAHCSEKNKATIESALGNRSITERQQRQVQDIVRASGALANAQKVSKKYITKAQDLIDRQDWAEDKKRFLRGLSEFALKRKS